MKIVWCILLIILPFVTKSQVGTITTVAGNGGPMNNGDGLAATAASIGANAGIAFDRMGNYYFTTGNKVRKVSSSGIISTIAGTGVAGYSGDGGAATAATLNQPIFIACDLFDNIYVSEVGNSTVRKINAITGVITTVAGTGVAGYNSDGIPATSAHLNSVYGICFDPVGNLYLADYLNCRIRKVNTAGYISTIAGTGTCGYSGDGGAATVAQIFPVYGICSDKSVNIYTCDAARVRKINISTGVITTIAGSGLSSTGGDGGAATNAGINPQSVVISPTGELYICELGNNDVRRVNTFGVITKIAGTGGTGFSGDGGSATLATIWAPRGVATDTCGNVFICDNSNFRIRKVTFNPLPCPYLSVDEQSIKKEVSVYPNPVNDEIYIEASPGLSRGEVVLCNMVGQVVLSEQLNSNHSSLNIKHLPPGLYLLALTGKDGKRTVYKIVKE